jgi:hypothetical protein
MCPFALWRCNVKAYITKIELERVHGQVSMRTRKYCDTPMGEHVVEDRTPMAEAAIRAWLTARGWYYAGHGAGVYTYKPGSKATALTVEV